MREIEFRAWLKSQKEMVRVKTICLEKKGVIIVYDKHKREGVFLFEEIELLEYTGLKDKNGKKIFEGDIVNTYMEKCVVCWNEKHCCFETRKDNSYTQLGLLSTKFLEVIGNIYDNPELLNN